MKTNKVSIWHVAIPVRDLKSTVQFYCDKLGFHLLGIDDYPSKKQAFVAVEKNGFTIEFFEPKKDMDIKIVSKPDHLAFEVEDLKTYRDALADKTPDVPEVDTFENGIHYISLKDPDGMPVEFFQGRKIYEDFLSTQ